MPGPRSQLRELSGCEFPNCSAASCAISSKRGGSPGSEARESRSIVLQKGQAAPIVVSPVDASSLALAALTRSPVSSPRNTKPPPAPQQNPRSRERGGSTTLAERAITCLGSSYLPRYRPK